MTEQTDNNPKAIERIKKPLKDILQNFTFTLGDIDFSNEDYCFSHARGFFICKIDYVDKLKDKLQGRFTNISQESIEERIRESALSPLLDSFCENQKRDWRTSFELKNCGVEIATDDQLEWALSKLFDDLRAIVRDYAVFVPVMGISLTTPNYDFGPVKIVRTEDSLPIPEKRQGSTENPNNPNVMSYFESIPCLVESFVSGDTRYARQEGLRLATQLAAILNLHLARWSIDNHLQQKIQCVGVPTFSTRVILARTNLPDPSGNKKPIYLQETKTRSIYKHTLNTSQLNAIKQQGFDKIWECFGKSNKLCKRIERSISWYDKAANFYEADAQFVGFATALEILLVSNSSLSSPYSTWSGITQQLAERCAFLLGHNLKSTMEMAVHVKRLYGVRSSIVHSGKEPTLEDLEYMSDLVSRVILDFAQRDFSSFQDFEMWIERLKYSCNLSEIESLLHQ